MVNIMIGLNSGEYITADGYTLDRYEDLIRLWSMSKKIFSNKFLHITSASNKGKVITIYLPDIVFIRKDEVKDIDEDSML